MSQHIYLAIAERFPIYSSLLSAFLKLKGQYRICFTAHSGAELLQKLGENRTSPDILLFDSLLCLDGQDVHAEIKKSSPTVKTLILSPFEDDEQAIRFLQQGASGYIVKNGEPEEIATAVKNISEGYHHYPAGYPEYKRLKAHLGRFSNAAGFTAREMQVMKLLCTDMSVEEIAAEIGLRDRTVERIKKSIYTKAKVRQRHMLVKYCIRYGVEQIRGMGVDDMRYVASI